MCNWAGRLQSCAWKEVWCGGCSVEVGGYLLKREVWGDRLGREGLVWWEGGSHYGGRSVAKLISWFLLYMRSCIIRNDFMRQRSPSSVYFASLVIASITFQKLFRGCGAWPASALWNLATSGLDNHNVGPGYRDFWSLLGVSKAIHSLHTMFCIRTSRAVTAMVGCAVQKPIVQSTR